MKWGHLSRRIGGVSWQGITTTDTHTDLLAGLNGPEELDDLVVRVAQHVPLVDRHQHLTCHK